MFSFHPSNFSEKILPGIHFCLGEASFLNGQYSAFGQIADDESLETLKKIGKVPVKDGGTGEKSTPIDTTKINKMTVTEV